MKSVTPFPSISYFHTGMQIKWTPMQLMYIRVQGSKSHQPVSWDECWNVSGGCKPWHVLMCYCLLLLLQASNSHTFLAWAGESENRSARALACAVGWWLCTVVTYHPVAWRSFACEDPPRDFFFFFPAPPPSFFCWGWGYKLQMSLQCEENVWHTVWSAVRDIHQLIRLGAHLCSRPADEGM